MSIKRPEAIHAAQVIAQDAGNLRLLLNPTDYNVACDVALAHFGNDRPNHRVRHVTIGASSFVYVLGGTGTVLPTSGLDAWVNGSSEVLAVFTPYLTTTPDNVPIDPTQWSVVQDPPDGSGPITVLHLRSARPASGSVMRLEYVRPHVLDDADAALTSILAGDVAAFETLLAAKICEAAARRYVQNTGSSAFQTESVDRRTQSDVMASRAKDLVRQYGEIVGRASDSIISAAAIQKMSIPTSHGRGRLWNHG